MTLTASLEQVRVRVGAVVRSVLGRTAAAPASDLPTGPLPATVAGRPTLAVAAPVGFLGLAAGFLLRSPALIAVAAPSAALVATGLSTLARPRPESGPSQPNDLGVTATLRLSTARVVVDDDVVVSVELTAHEHVRGLELAVHLPVGVVLTEGDALASVDLDAGEVRTHSFTVRGTAPRARVIGPVVLRRADAFGLTETEQVATDTRTLHVVPGGEFLRTLLRAMHTGGHVGEQMSRRRGEGFEFADLRPWVPGDPARRIHWRASARRDDPVVIERRPDRNQDVIVVIDAHDESRPSAGQSTLERSMELAAGIASAHLRARDRVGYIGLGSHLSWLTARSGQLQRHRLLDALVSLSTDGRGLGRVPSALPSSIRPARAVVVVITPMLDDRSMAVLRDLRAHRYDVVVVIVDPVPDPAVLVAGEPNGDIGVRFWRLRRDDVVASVAASGCAVTVATRDAPLEQIVREVMTWRRQMPANRRSAG